MSSYKSTNFDKSITEVNILKLHNNEVKQWYMKNFCSVGKTLLDVGVGRLNDAKIWKVLNFEKFIGIEPSSDSLKIASTRVYSDKISLHQGSAQDDWGPFIGRRKCSHILFNWTFHYGNKTEEELQKVLLNIKKYSAVKSRVCILTMDGDKIFSNLLSTNSFSYGYFSATKGSFTDNTPKLFGQDIIIKFKGVYGLEEGVIEYIVPINSLIQAMDSIGFRLIHKFNFLDIWDSARSKLSENSKKVSSLYNGLIFETKPELLPLPDFLKFSDNVYTREAPKNYMKPWFPSNNEMEFMRLATYFITNPCLYVAIYKKTTPNIEILQLFEKVEQRSFGSFIKFITGKQVNGLLYEFDINEEVLENKLYCVRVFILHKSGTLITNSDIIPIYITSNVPEMLGSFTNSEHDKILKYQNLEMVKKLHRKRPFNGGASWNISEKAIPEQSSFPMIKKELQELSPIDRYSCIIFSGSILEILGTTVANDVDLIVWNPNNTPDLNNLFDKKIDLTMWDGTKYLPHTLDYKIKWFNEDFPKLYGAKSMEETIYDPRFHFYWKGLKFICIQATVSRLISRARPSGYTDLIILGKIGLPIKFPLVVPKTSIMQGYLYDYTKRDNQQQLLRTIQYYLKTWHGQTMSTEELLKKITLPSI